MTEEYFTLKGRHKSIGQEFSAHIYFAKHNVCLKNQQDYILEAEKPTIY